MDPTLEIVKEIIEFGNRPAHSNAKTIFSIFKDKRYSTTNSWDYRANWLFPDQAAVPGFDRLSQYDDWQYAVLHGAEPEYPAVQGFSVEQTAS